MMKVIYMVAVMLILVGCGTDETIPESKPVPTHTIQLAPRLQQGYMQTAGAELVRDSCHYSVPKHIEIDEGNFVGWDTVMGASGPTGTWTKTENGVVVTLTYETEKDTLVATIEECQSNVELTFASTAPTSP